MERSTTYRFPFARYPAVRLTLLFSTGIILSRCTEMPLWIWLFLLTGSISGCVVAERYSRHRTDPGVYSLLMICYLSGTAIFGGFWYGLHREKSGNHTEIFEAYSREELIFRGEVYRLKMTGGERYHLDLAVDTTNFGTGELWIKSYNLRTLLDPAERELPPGLAPGDRLTVRATVFPLENRRNPHDFDYKSYLASEKIFLQARVQSIISHHAGSKMSGWIRLRQKALTAIDANFDRDSRSIAKALLFGYRDELSREEKRAFSRAGLSHIMAVSGLHVGFILAPFWLIIPFFWTFRYGKELGLIFLVLLLVFYAGLTGFSASVTRASLVGGLLMYGRLFHKAGDSKNLTALAAAVILLGNPDALFTIGFQLSFGAVYIIFLTAPLISRHLSARIRFSWYGMPVMAVIIAFLVQVGLFPLLIYYFGEFSIVGPLANAVILPFLTFAVPAALFLLPVSLFLPAVSHLLNLPIQLFLNCLHLLVEHSAGLSWSWFRFNLTTPLLFPVWLFALFAAAAWTIPKLRWKYISLFLVILCLHQGELLTGKISAPPLRVTVFDVGQGDAVLVSTPGNRHFLIDTGGWTPSYTGAEYVIIPHLKAEGISKLNAIFLSHPHADHIGGTAEILDRLPVDTLYHTGIPYDSDLYRNYMIKVARKQIPARSLSAGDMVNLDPTVRIFIYGPGNTETPSNVNDRSLIMELVYGSTEFLFMGDAERRQEKRLVDRYPEMTDTDFLKAGHHGSRTSSNSFLLKAATPQISVVSVGRKNRFGHPHPRAVQRLRQSDTRLYFTSLEGALLFESDGRTVRRKKWR